MNDERREKRDDETQTEYTINVIVERAVAAAVEAERERLRKALGESGRRGTLTQYWAKDDDVLVAQRDVLALLGSRPSKKNSK